MVLAYFMLVFWIIINSSLHYHHLHQINHYTLLRDPQNLKMISDIKISLPKALLLFYFGYLNYY